MLDKIKKFKDFVGPEVWKYLLFSILIGLAWFAVESSFVFVIQGFLFSIGLLNKSQVFLPSWFPTSLGSSISILILFGLARACVYMLKTYFASQTQVAFICNQRRGLLHFGLKNAGVVSSKKLTTAFTEVASQAGVVVYYISILINTLIAAVLFLLLGLRLATFEMIIGVSLLMLLLFPLKKFAKTINNYGVGLVKEWENVSDSLIKGLRNYFFLSIYNQIDFEIKKGEESLDKYKLHYTDYSRIVGVMSAFPLLIGVCILSLITYISVKFIHTDGMKLVSFFYLFIRLAQAASEANATFSNVKLNFPGFKILYEWKLKLKISEGIYKLPNKIIKNEPIDVEFVNVSLKYENQDYLFKDLSFKISKGEVFIIKGESGTGKSSLLSLILDVNKPNKGEVLISGISTIQYKLDLQNVLAYVGPEPFMIAGSVRENLLYGLPNTTVADTDIWNILKKVHIYDLIQNLPNKLDELIYDIPQFSTGQKQRLSFARALLRKPRLLILDEATANLDLETENIIIENLKEILKNCTTIIVTHKDSFNSVGMQFLNLGKIV